MIKGLSYSNNAEDILTCGDDNVINLTGESGSGKSYYSTKYKNDGNYIVIDTPDALLICPKDDAKVSGINTLIGLPEYEDYR